MKTFNKISPVGLGHFPEDIYDVSADHTNGQAILLRSQKLVEADIPIEVCTPNFACVCYPCSCLCVGCCPALLVFVLLVVFVVVVVLMVLLLLVMLSLCCCCCCW